MLIKLYRYSFEFHVIFLCQKYSFLIIFQLLKNVKIILSSRTFTNTAMKPIWPMGYSLSTPVLEDGAVFFLFKVNPSTQS